MSEVSRDAAVEGEAPVNPYSLLEAVNVSSRSAHATWLIFLGLSAYLLVAVAGVTHRDLLLHNDVALPVLQAKLELTRFFLTVPAALLFIHLVLLVQLVALARKSLELDAALRMLEATDRRSHPLRLELNGFFLTQAIAGPERSRVFGLLLQGMGWLTLALLPVLALLFVQAAFLPYHHAGVTQAHRWLVVADIAVLVVVAAFFVSREQSLLLAVRTSLRAAPVRSALGVLGAGVGAALAVLVITVPGEPAAHEDRRALFGLIERNLDVPDSDLTAGRNTDTGRPSINLRERDLRYARLDRSRLAHADLTGANLDGASLVDADLRGIDLGCIGSHRAEAPGDGNRAGCARAHGANLAKARLSGAMLSGADLAGARLVGADLAGATLIHANLSGASLSASHLDKADLSDANLQGADLSVASLSGADLSNAILTGADLTKAVLRAAVLNSADLDGVSLRNADLEAATLFRARLFAAELTGARIRAASLREARTWGARIPEGAESALADFSGLDAKIPSREEREVIARAIKGAGGGNREDALARLQAGEELGSEGAASTASWTALVRASEEATTQATTVIGSLVPTGSRLAGAEPSSSAVQVGGLAEQLRLSDRRARLTQHLVELACHPRAADGAIATGIARRAIGPGFNADPGALLDSFRRQECVGARTLPPALLERLANTMDLLNTR